MSTRDNLNPRYPEAGDTKRRAQAALRSSDGFSLVKLLVVIAIAGVAFAALVPLFLQAQGVQGADNARDVANKIAQDNREKIRQLDYDQIEISNIESSTYGGG